MQLTPVQDQAIAARVALIVGGATFDRLFAGVRFCARSGHSSELRARLVKPCNLGARYGQAERFRTKQKDDAGANINCKRESPGRCNSPERRWSQSTRK